MIINRFTSVFKNDAPDGEAELTISPKMEALFKEVFEIEMLQGTRTVLPNGAIHFKMELTREKSDIVIASFRQAMFKQQKICYN